MTDKEEVKPPKFIRHIQFGPGKVVDHDPQTNKVIVRYRDVNGKLEENTYQYELSDWKIKEIPEDSLLMKRDALKKLSWRSEPEQNFTSAIFRDQTWPLPQSPPP